MNIRRGKSAPVDYSLITLPNGELSVPLPVDDIHHLVEAAEGFRSAE